MKSQVKPGIVRGFSIILFQVKEKSGKTNYLVLILMSITLSMVICKMDVPFAVSKRELYHFA